MHSRSRTAKLVVIFFVVCAVFVAFQSRTHSQSPVITPQTNINQNNLGKTPQVNPTVAQLLESGGQFWTTPFLVYDPLTNTGDGYGEGGKFGPRAMQRQVFNPPGFPQYRFLRMNGLDSQSCYECHNSIGSDPGYGANSPLIRKPGSVGGSAGSNSNAFINPMFPGTPQEPNKFLTLLVRQPPHVFGTGYTTMLASEMTQELFDQKYALRQLAVKNPGKQQSVNLTAKGLSFGVFKTTYTGTQTATVNGNIFACSPAAATAQNDGGMIGFTDDVSGVQGVTCDLIVRPLQWKGISSSVRHFVRDALNFHFSMQAEELTGQCDCDLDGKPNPKNKTPEMTIGNVTAMTAFVGMTRPPQQIVPPDKQQSVQLGYQIFTGNMTPGTAPSLQSRLYQNMCANCHIPALALKDPTFKIDIPFTPDVAPCPVNNMPFQDQKTGCPQPASYAVSKAALVTPLKSAEQHTEIKRVKRRLGIAESTPLRSVLLNLITRRNRAAPTDALVALLNPKLTAPPHDEEFPLPLSPPVSTDYPAYIYPRLPLPFFPALPAPTDGTLNVPFFSDLRQHNMGKFLADRPNFAQGTDVAGLCIPEPLFLTRPLWGVADTGPWLHDGRALTLMDAIMLHGDSATGSGSDARMVVDAFQKLSPVEKQAVVDFLLTLRLPLEQGVIASNP